MVARWKQDVAGPMFIGLSFLNICMDSKYVEWGHLFTLHPVHQWILFKCKENVYIQLYLINSIYNLHHIVYNLFIITYIFLITHMQHIY